MCVHVFVAGSRTLSAGYYLFAYRPPGRARARMRSGNLSRRFLARSLVVVLFALHSFALGKATNLEFYQDVEPERTLDIANSYEEISRRLLLEAEKDAEQASASRDTVDRETAYPPKLPWEYANYLKLLRRQKEKELLEALLENPSLLNDALESSRASRPKERESANFPYSTLERYETPVERYEADGMTDDDEQSRRRYAASDRFQDYVEPGISGYARNIFRNENKPRYPQRPLMRMMARPNNVEDEADENYPVISYPERIPDQALTLGLEEKLARMNGAERRDLVEDQTRPRVPEQRQPIPDFTYRFDEPKNYDNAFAVKPNDPRYYETRHVPLESLVTTRAEKTTTTTTLDGRESSKETRKFETTDLEIPSSTERSKSDYIQADKFSVVKVSVPEMHRAEHDSGLVSASRIMNTDIYFIAIVAGCSAAAMFALVLISLTWCSRTASSRDPGSVSEAESDEENEEGDYTVYECPGLASAGEMEVKNPMFHDDPTSATAPHINHNKEEDHI